MISGELGKTSRILQFAWPFKSLDGFHYQQIHRYRLILPSDRESRTGSRSTVLNQIYLAKFRSLGEGGRRYR
jgi:hypothetical protein